MEVAMVWLIENRGKNRDSVPMWWSAGPDGRSDWGVAIDATRFARREDAEAVIRHLFGSVDGPEVTEHGVHATEASFEGDDGP